MKRGSQTPGSIERNFRKELGKVNPYLCLIDAAVQSFIETGESACDSNKTLKKIAGKYNHHNLFIDHLSLGSLRRFTYGSHIAFIIGTADAACKRIQDLDFMLSKAKGDVEGDFLRKTIGVIHCSKANDLSLAKDIESSLFESYVGDLELKILDYFKRLRNTDFHSSDSNEKVKVTLLFEAIDQDQLSSKYHSKLHNPELIVFSDVLLLSRIWQATIKRVCSNCYDLEEVRERLNKAFSGISNLKRRREKIKQTLRQEYLQTELPNI